MTSLPDLSAVDLVSRYRDRSLSPVEVTEAVLARIEAWEPKLQALWALDAAGARAAAAASAARWAEGRPLGPVDGVPVTVKDNIATRGVPVPVGTAATPLVPAAEDAPPAARLRESGAVILAKTTMPDYGMLSSGLSSFHKLARNPWDLSKNPGGSSAGAGAAAAAGYGPIHVGTDIGGSVRLPAAWCGIVGLKPSLGRIPIDPSYVGRVAGPMTRTVADAALAMAVLSRPDGRDGMNLPPAEIDWADLAIDPKGLRIGLMMDIGAGMALDPEVGDAVTAAARLLEAAGGIVEPVPAILTREMLDGLDDFWRVRSWDDVSKLPAADRAKILPYIRAWAESGAERSGLAVMRGFNRTMEIRKAAAALFASLDFVLSPTAPVAGFPADWASPLNDPEKPFEHIGYTVPWNMSEQPAVSINCGFTAAGLPIGLQIVGRRFDDLGVLRLAQAYEDRRGPQRPWPVL
ncbi:aspartyl-tRNA(Asn)/glutamyl-tRNA(Gln) amidotransferase subunit A [Inquilinus ginsengisoli]|uniref:Aspartyl-tRNA(Asn)/glutamyl-tRNA(Gln) amidotransferase subunit A n=1 Tax=Inquilinus ginsengisoli TaxID=363840 RepID=A0ABU1JJ85_9PROT|nr:amidase [Inquilinus ginsengisoli]MDR6288671.1 aspartyl-tRNA(Asn)/glutamyl-tRNA(Gln) amidotransferase subunit A [Inquilinus ginsengisoli]